MRVQGFTPTYPGGLRRETRRAVEGQTVACDWRVGMHNPHPAGDMRNVLAQYERGREEFLASDADAWWLVEHDNVPPDNALELMLRSLAEAPVVYAPYVFRHGTKTLSAYRLEGRKELGMSLMHYPEELDALRRAGVGEVSGCGFGCTLLRRDVVAAVPFRVASDGSPIPDTPFAEDVLRSGRMQLCRFDVPVGHFEDGRLLHAYDDMGTRDVKVRVHETVNAYAGDRVWSLTAGTVVEVRRDAATDLQRAGYVTLVEDAQAGKPKAKRRVA